MKKKSTIIAKFLRAKCTGEFTGLYSELAQEDKNIIENSFTRRLDEDFVISYFDKEQNYFWILTTGSILIGDSDNKMDYSYSEITNVELLFNDETSADHKLIINLKDGNVQLKTEIGTWGVVFSMLKFLRSV